MQLPKRVPWASIAELEQLCSWIFSEGDVSTKVLAVNRLAAWKASAPLPHALESTLSLLVAILQDEDSANTSVPHPSTLSLRQSYSLALIRLVNGLVDPLQHGAYARPIASIAAQIGLPLRFVELRHASTHEELPSLELLRECASDAMSWLLHNYFLPTLSPQNQSAAPTSLPLSPLSPLLSHYKKLLKMTTRDASLKAPSKPALHRILRAIEQWISEAKIVAPLSQSETQIEFDEEDERERWALEQFCNELIGRHGLVPTAKRKRPSPLKDLTIPIPQHIDIWSPLILHVYSCYPDFLSVLLSRIIAQLSSDSTTPVGSASEATARDTPAVDPTYDQSLASWALWIVNKWDQDPTAQCERAVVVKELMLSLGWRPNKSARALLTALSADDPRLRQSVTLLCSTMQSSTRTSAWGDDTLEVMSKRLSLLRPDSSVLPVATPIARPALDSKMTSLSKPISAVTTDEPRIKGWRLLDESSGWTPCPIGVYKATNS